jgi:KDO2-lipid IV(A) lauroyltransferase
MTIYYLYRSLGIICPLLPARFGYWLFERIGDIGFWLTARPTSTYIENLRHVLGEQATQSQLNTAARRGHQNLLKNYFDLFRAHGLTKEKIHEQLAGVEGLDHVEKAIKRGKGVVAGSGHFGAWDMVIHLTVQFLDVRVIVPQEHFKPEKLFRYIQALRKSQGMDVVPMENAPREITKALRAGSVVGLAYDRDITESGQIIDFFGAPARLPDGAVQLAFKYDCAVIVGFAVREPDNRVRVIIEPPLKFERTGDYAKDLCAGVRKIAAVMERYFRKYPDQWLMFQKVWVDGKS